MGLQRSERIVARKGFDMSNLTRIRRAAAGPSAAISAADGGVKREGRSSPRERRVLKPAAHLAIGVLAALALVLATGPGVRAAGQAASTPVALAFGGTLPGSIDLLAETDAYTFSGSVGDTVLARVGSGVLLYPDLRIYRPDGTLLCTGTVWTGYWTEATCPLDAPGKHTILVGGGSGTRTGAYDVHLQR
jgi:hypothetical protein